MRKRHFKLGIVALIGLALYFLTLSAALVAAASGPDSDGFGFSISKRPRVHRDLPQNQTANSRSDGKSAKRKFAVRAIGQGGNEAAPCWVSTACAGSTFDQDPDGSSAWGGSGLGRSVSTNSQNTSFNGSDSSNPYGYNLFDTNPAFGSMGNGGLPQNGSGPNSTNNAPGAISPEVTEPDPSLPFVAPGISPLPQVSLLLPTDPPGSAEPSTDTQPSDPAPPHNPSGTVTVPEPPTFWLFLANLIVLTAAPRFAQRLWTPSNRIGRQWRPISTLAAFGDPTSEIYQRRSSSSESRFPSSSGSLEQRGRG